MRTDDAVADLRAAVAAIAAWNGGRPVHLLGWATGGHWTGAYAARHPEQVGRLVILNSLYGGSADHPTLGRGSATEDPRRPGQFNTAAFGAYRLNTGPSLLTAWDRSIPGEDKAAWRDPAVAEAYVAAALASDPSSSRTPASFRAPSGAMADSFELALDRRQWSAAVLPMPVLVIRGGRDFWSRPEDAAALASEAPRARLVTIPQATHFVHLDRDTAGRAVFLQAVVDFLRDA
jgi:pimeloyl-ACP methyl ester carboxylesterase